MVRVVVKGPGVEFLNIADVFPVAEANQGRGSVLVENSLVFVGGLLEELVPLGLEELHHCDVDLVGVPVREGISNELRTLEIGAVNSTSNSNTGHRHLN